MLNGGPGQQKARHPTKWGEPQRPIDFFYLTNLMNLTSTNTAAAVPIGRAPSPIQPLVGQPQAVPIWSQLPFQLLVFSLSNKQPTTPPIPEPRLAEQPVQQPPGVLQPVAPARFDE